MLGLRQVLARHVPTSQGWRIEGDALSEQAQPYDDDYEAFEGYDADCSTCMGDGSEECMDSFMCFEPDCTGEWHTCPNCRGSGRAEDMHYW